MSMSVFAALQLAFLLIVATALASAIHLLGMAIAARLMRLRVDTMSFGVGPTLATLQLGRKWGTLALKPLPFAGSLNFGAPDRARDERGFDELGRAAKIATALSGSIACLIVAAIGLGPSAGWRETVASWGEFVAVLPAFPVLGALWAPIAEAAESRGIGTLTALACAKVAGLNLLPLAPLNGGMAILFLLGWRPGDKAAAVDAYVKVSIAIALALGLLWVWGAVAFVRGR